MISLPFAVCLLVFSLSVFSQSPKVPTGWRFPTTKDMQGGWKTYKKDVPMPYKISGDFNWDKLKDEVWLLISSRGKDTGIFVFLGQKDKSFRSVQLDYFENEKPFGFYLSNADKGKYDTACGKGYWKCGENEPAVLDLKGPGIFFDVYETASKLFYWNPERKTFESVAISD